MYDFIIYINNPTTNIIDDELGKIYKTKIVEKRKALEDSVNVLNYNPEEEYTAFDAYLTELGQEPERAGRYAKNMVFILALYWIDFYSKNPKQTPTLDRNTFGLFIDDRNEQTKERCVEVYNMPEFKELLHLYANDIDYNKRFDDIYEEAYGKFMKEVIINMHPTNQQSATRLMLYSLQTVKDPRAERIVSRLKETYGKDYWKLWYV